MIFNLIFKEFPKGGGGVKILFQNLGFSQGLLILDYKIYMRQLTSLFINSDKKNVEIKQGRIQKRKDIFQSCPNYKKILIT